MPNKTLAHHIAIFLVLFLIAIPVLAQEQPARATIDPEAPTNTEPTVAVRAEITEGNAQPGIANGETFTVDFHFVDLHTGTERSAFAGFVDVEFDPTKLQVVGDIAYDNDYTYLNTGTVDNTNGQVDEVGAVSNRFEPVSDEAERRIFSITFQAIAEGPYTLSTSNGASVFSQIVVYGLDTDQKESTQHLSIEIPAEVQAPNPVVTVFDAFPDHVLGAETTISYTITNQGNQASDEFLATLYLSDDATCNANDVEVATFTIPALSVGASHTDSPLVSLPPENLFNNALSDDAASLINQQNLNYTSQNIDVLCLLVPDFATPANLDVVQATGAPNSDDITYFPWDVLGDDETITPLEALGAIQTLGRDSDSHDYDLNGVVTPTEALSIILRQGYERNTSVDEPNPNASVDPAAALPVVANRDLPVTDVRLEIVELDDVAGIQVGESFNVNVYMQDAAQQALFSGFVDVNFDPAYLRVDGVRYGVGYESLQSGRIDAASGLVNELGASVAALSQPADSLVAILRVTALRPGATNLVTDAAENAVNQTLTYGVLADARNAMQHASLNLSITPILNPADQPPALPAAPTTRESDSSVLPVQPVNPQPTPTPLPQLPVQGR